MNDVVFKIIAVLVSKLQHLFSMCSLILVTQNRFGLYFFLNKKSRHLWINLFFADTSRYCLCFLNDQQNINYTFLCLQLSLYEIPSVSPSSFSQHFRRLLDESDEMDSIHDVTLQAGNRTFPAHKYILSMRSEFFRKLFMSERCGVPDELDGEVRKSEDAVGCDLIIFEKIPADMLEYALRFIYTDSCELLVHGAKPRGSAALTGQTQVWLKKKKQQNNPQ